MCIFFLYEDGKYIKIYIYIYIYMTYMTYIHTYILYVMCMHTPHDMNTGTLTRVLILLSRLIGCRCLSYATLPSHRIAGTNYVAFRWRSQRDGECVCLHTPRQRHLVQLYVRTLFHNTKADWNFSSSSGIVKISMCRMCQLYCCAPSTTTRNF